MTNNEEIKNIKPKLEFNYTDVVLDRDNKIDSRERVIGRLEGYIESGLTIPYEDLQKILDEYSFTPSELGALVIAQSNGIPRGLALEDGSDRKRLWWNYGERGRNMCLLAKKALEGEKKS